MFRSDVSKALNIHDLRLMAKKKLPHWLFEFIDRGSEDEIALRNNRAAFERIKLNTRVLTDVSKRSQEITLFGKKHSMPLGISPTGPAGTIWYKGELELARAAKAANVPFTVATLSTTSLEEIAKEVGGTLWFQLQMFADANMSYKIVERAKNAGYEALLVTVDGPVPTNREYNVRNGFTSPFRYTRKNTAAVLVKPGWMFGVMGRYMMTTGMPRRENVPTEMKERVTEAYGGMSARRNDGVTWGHFDELRKIWPGKLILKGVLTPRDAQLAVEHGADGVLVSNHGGRQFDSSMAPMEVLPSIVDAVGSRTTVLADSSFRRGSDVVKALALGAKMVMVGRAPLWGVAVAGEAGAARALYLLRQEISRTQGYLGCNSIDELNRDFVQYVATPHVPMTM